MANRQWTYRLYAPRSYPEEPGRRWPVLFVVAPGGGTTIMVRRFAEGAEFNRWLVVAPVQWAGDAVDGLDPLDTVMRDVIQRLPVDRSRLFLCGFAEGARLALRAVTRGGRERLRGLLLIGDTDVEMARGVDAPLYAVCGVGSPRRSDVSRMFEHPRRGDWRLEWVAAGNDWPADEDLALGMTWLNVAILSRSRNEENGGLERKKFEEALVQHVWRTRTAAPERASDWAECLTLLNSPRVAEEGVFEPHPMALRVREEAKVRKYREGRQELLAVTALFIQETGEARRPEATIIQRARELAMKYGDTRLRPIFERLAQPVAR